MAEVALLINDQPVVQGAPLALPRAGLKLVLRVSQGATLTSVTLRLSAQSATEKVVYPAHISSDLGGFPACSKGNKIRFVNATFEDEITICRLTLAGAKGWA